MNLGLVCLDERLCMATAHRLAAIQYTHIVKKPLPYPNRDIVQIQHTFDSILYVWYHSFGFWYNLHGQYVLPEKEKTIYKLKYGHLLQKNA